MPFKDPSSPAAKASAKRRHMKYRAARPRQEARERRQAYAISPDHDRQRVADWRKRHPEIARYTNLKSAAKSRGLECSIGFDEYVALTLDQYCYYCGGGLPQGTGYGVDQINAGIGYVTGNVRPCCGECNTAKSNMTEIEFKIWALRLANHWAMKEN